MAANQFEIPGLEDSIKNFKVLSAEFETMIKQLLEIKMKGEAAMGAFKNTETLKGYKKAIDDNKAAYDAEAKAVAALGVVQAKLDNAQSNTVKLLAEKSLQLQRENQLTKENVKLNGENASSLDKLNAQINKYTRESKELGAQMVLLKQEGKGTSDEYNKVAAKFQEASAKSKELNDSYRDISKTAGDNRALVGSYADELKGSFGQVTDGVKGVKDAIERGDIGGAFASGKSAVMGFTEAIKRTQTQASDTGTEMSKTGSTIGDLKSKVTDTTKDLKNFFKPSAENSDKMTQGIQRMKIGFSQNSEAVNTAKNSLVGHNAETEKGGLISTIFARAQLALSGATGVASGAMNILKVAIASTGIGLIIIAVGLLVAGLMKLDPVMDKIEQLFAGLSGGINKAIDIVTSFVTNITSLQDGLSKLGDIIAHPIDSLKKLGKALGDSAVAMAKLKEAEQSLEDNTKIFDLRNKRLESEINLDKIRLRSKNLTAAELDKIEKNIESKEKQISSNKNKLADEEIRIALETAKQRGKINNKALEDQIRNGELIYANFLLNAGKIDQAIFDQLQKAASKKVETNNRLAESEEANQAKIEKAADRVNAQREKAQSAAEKAREKATADREKAEKKAEDDAKKSAERAISAMKSALDYKIATYNQEENSASDNLAYINSISLMKQKIAEAELKKNMIGVVKGSQDEKLIKQKSADDIQKIKLEESNAINAANKKNVQFELELYDFRNQTLIDAGAELTDILVDQEKSRLIEFLKIHLDALAKELEIDDAKLQAKIKNNEKLSESDLKYLKGKQALEKQTNTAIKKNDADLLKSKEKTLNDEQKNNNRIFNLSENGKFKRQQNALKEEKKNLEGRLKLVEKGSQEEKEISISLAENKKETDDAVVDAKMAGLDKSLSTFISIVGQESAVGKAAAIAQATINTYQAATRDIAEYPAPFGQIAAALDVAFGLVQVSKIAGIKTFAVGTDDAPYTGKAIVDELGPEFHFDQNWNLKSKGSEGGPRLTDIVKGDKIIPADISAILKQSMYTGGSVVGTNAIDYNKIGEQFNKSTEKLGNKLARELKSNRSAVSINVQKNITDRVIFRGKNV